MVRLTKGLDLPIQGAPSLNIDTTQKTSSVAVTGADFVGMKPTMLVKEGDSVKIGQPLFSCKKNIGLMFTSPAAGKIKEIRRGERRVFQNIEIEVAESEEHTSFKSHLGKSAESYSADEMRKLLIESGEWVSLRQRPYDKVADVDRRPSAIFVTAIDTNPLAMPVNSVLKQRQEDFSEGVKALSVLSEDKTYICQSPNDSAWENPKGKNIEVVEFSGPHPAGNPGTHIHFLEPVHGDKIVWHVGYQDVVAIGHLIKTGQLELHKVISFAGPNALKPRLMKVRRGAKLTELSQGEVMPDSRVISGSVLNGRTIDSEFQFLGHYANQVSIIEEDDKRELLGWHTPGFDRFSNMNIYVSKLNPFKKFKMTSSTNGSLRAMVPIGAFEKVNPLDILPTQLLRALASKDTDTAQELGCMDLAEEDLALMTYVAPGKVDFGQLLRENLATIEKEG